MASTASCMNWHCPGQISMQTMGTTNKQCSLGVIRFLLNRASPELKSLLRRQPKAGSRLYPCPCLTPEKQASGAECGQTPRPHLLGLITSAFLFGWRSQRKCRATPTPNYRPNIGLSWSSLNNFCSHEQWAHRRGCANFSEAKSRRAGVDWT